MPINYLYDFTLIYLKHLLIFKIYLAALVRAACRRTETYQAIFLIWVIYFLTVVKLPSLWALVLLEGYCYVKLRAPCVRSVPRGNLASSSITAEVGMEWSGAKGQGFVPKRRVSIIILTRAEHQEEFEPFSNTLLCLGLFFSSYSLPQEEAVSRTSEWILPWLLIKGGTELYSLTAGGANFPAHQWTSSYFQVLSPFAVGWELFPECISLCLTPSMCPINCLTRKLHRFKLLCNSQYCRAIFSTEGYQHTHTYFKVLVQINSLWNVASQQFS